MFSAIAVVAVLVLRGWREAFKAAVIVALFAGSYELFRLTYYHAPVSNAAYLKLNPGWNAIKMGFHYVASFNFDSALWPLPMAIVGLMAIRRLPVLAIPAAFVGAQLFFIGFSGGDFMYGYRFLVPILPPLMLLIVAGMALVPTRLGAAAGGALAGAACLTRVRSRGCRPAGQDHTLGQSDLPRFDDVRCGRLPPQPCHNASHDADVGVRDRAVFYAESQNVDYLGLTSLHDVIDEHGVFLVDKLLQTRPHYVLLSFWIGQDKIEFTRLPQEAAILNNEMFKANYTAVRDFEIDRDASFLNAIYYRYWPDALRIRFPAL